jgi:serine/threonine protein kinase
MEELKKKYDYDHKELLGSGTYGKVYSIKEIEGDKQFALKEMVKDFNNNKLTSYNKNKPTREENERHKQQISMRIVMELSIMRNNDINPHLASIQDIYINGDMKNILTLGVVMPMFKVSLKDVIYRPNNGLDYDTIKFFSAQLLSGLAALSNLDIMHRDIKPDNLMISEGNVLTIIDFGDACCSSEENLHPQLNPGTIQYRSPEVLMGSVIYDESVDIWAAACVIIEMFKGEEAFRATNYSETYTRMKKLAPPDKRTLSADIVNYARQSDDFKEQHNIFKEINPEYDASFTPLHLIDDDERRKQVEKWAGNELNSLNYLLKRMLVIDKSNRQVTLILIQKKRFWGREYMTYKKMTKRDLRIKDFILVQKNTMDNIKYDQSENMASFNKRVLREIVIPTINKELKVSPADDDGDEYVDVNDFPYDESDEEP